MRVYEIVYKENLLAAKQINEVAEYIFKIVLNKCPSMTAELEKLF